MQKKPGEKEGKEFLTTEYSPKVKRINRLNRRESRQDASNQFDPRAILHEASSVDFRQRDQADNFKRNYNDYLLGRTDTGTSRDNILHVLADNKDNWTDDQTQTFLDWLLKEYHGLLEKKDKLGYAPLFRALLDEKHAFVGSVLCFSGLKNLGNVLKLTCDKGNILHVAIDMESPHINTIIEKCKSYPAIFLQGDSTEETPLHYAVSLNVSEKDLEVVLRKYGIVAKDALPKQQTVESGSALRRVGTSSQGPRPPKQHVLSPSEPTPADWTLIDEGPRYGVKGIQPLEIVKRLIDACPPALSEQNSDGQTPYRCREFELRHSKIVEDTLDKILETTVGTSDRVSPEEMRDVAFRRIFVEDSIASHIREYCMCNLARDEIMRCLYQPGQGELDQDSPDIFSKFCTDSHASTRTAHRI